MVTVKSMGSKRPKCWRNDSAVINCRTGQVIVYLPDVNSVQHDYVWLKHHVGWTEQINGGQSPPRTHYVSLMINRMDSQVARLLPYAYCNSVISLTGQFGYSQDRFWSSAKWQSLALTLSGHVVVNFLSLVIFVFLLFLGMVMYAHEVETTEK